MSGEWRELVRRSLATEAPPHRQAHRRAGDAVRGLIEQLMSRSAPTEVLEQAAAEVEALAERLAAYPNERGRFVETPTADAIEAVFGERTQVGLGNPLSPPLTLTVTDDGISATACFSAAYEGAPGCVHGGHVAAAFDEVLGMTNAVSGRPGMTGTLTIRYRKPTPLYTDLVFEGRVEHIEGRKVFTRGLLLAGDVLTAEADGTFVVVDFDRIAEEYGGRRTPTGEQ